MSVTPIRQDMVIAVNGRASFDLVRWSNDLINGHVGDAATLAGQLPAYYALASHTHAGVYVAAGTLGQFSDVAFATANFTAESGDWTVAAPNQVTYSYSVDGKRLTVVWEFDSTTTTLGTASLRLKIPGSLTAAHNASAAHAYRTFAGGWDMGSVQATAGSTWLTLYTRTKAAWPAEASTVYSRGSITLEVA